MHAHSKSFIGITAQTPKYFTWIKYTLPFLNTHQKRTHNNKVLLDTFMVPHNNLTSL